MVRINFGCGGNILKDYINVDLDGSQGADTICDMEVFPYPFPDNYADEILCEMTLEHIRTPSKAINEFYRIIKPDGFVKIIVPHFSDSRALSGDVHISTFNIWYFYGRKNCNTDILGRVQRSDGWCNKDYLLRWKDVNVDIVFPKGYATIISFPFQVLFNSCRFAQAVYEQYFSGFFRASEMVVVYRNKEVG